MPNDLYDFGGNSDPTPDYSLNDLFQTPVNNYQARQPDQYSGGFYEQRQPQGYDTPWGDMNTFANNSRRDVTSPQFFNQTTQGSFAPAEPYQMVDGYQQRMNSQYSGGDYEVDPDTGKPRIEMGSWRDKLKNFQMPQVSQGQADLFKGLASLYSAYQGNKQAGQLREAAKMQDPFGSQRAQYQQLLSQSYSNPNAYMNTPEAMLQQQALKQQLERTDAKSGRRSQYGARAVDLQMAQAKQLADYRAGLQQAAGSQIQPGNAAALYEKASQAQVDANAAPFQALSSIFQKQTPQHQNMQAIIDKLLGKGS